MFINEKWTDFLYSTKNKRYNKMLFSSYFLDIKLTGYEKIIDVLDDIPKLIYSPQSLLSH